MKKMQGVIAVTATLFRKDGSIDYESIAKHLDWMIKSGVHGILPAGATGEFASLSREERMTYAEFVVKAVDGRVPVMVGVCSQNVDETIQLANHAAGIQADAVMVLPPSGLHLSQNELYHFYKTVSQKTSLPIMVYNNPGSSGSDILPETMNKIAGLPRMDYLKESTGDIMRLTKMVDTLGDRLTVLCGWENLAYESLAMGARGWICVAANFAPAMCVELYELVAAKGQMQKGREVYRKLLPMLCLMEDSGELWQVVKHAAQRQGFGNGVLRAPRLPISAATKKKADFLMTEVKYA